MGGLIVGQRVTLAISGMQKVWRALGNYLMFVWVEGLSPEQRETNLWSRD